MRTISYSEYGGMDWHDCCETTDFLEENGSFSIVNPDTVIAKHLYRLMTEIQSDTFEKDVLTKSVRLQNIPSYDEVYKAVRDGKEIYLTSPEETDQYGTACELDFRYKNKKVTYCYGFGQVNYSGEYITEIIPDDKVQYLVVENFLAPTKGVPSVQRFYHKPYETEAEAKKAKESFVLHESHGSRVEILVSDKDKDAEKEWYKKNLQAIELAEKYPAVPFRIFIKAQLDEYGKFLTKETLT